MRYISTRGLDTDRSFEDVLLNGLARDGGLYLPKTWPRLSADDIRGMSSKSYAEIAGMIIGCFTGGQPEQSQITAMAEDAYKGFTHSDVAPLVALEIRACLRAVSWPHDCVKICYAVLSRALMMR